MSETPALERAVTLTGSIAHLIRPGERLPICGTGPVIRVALLTPAQRLAAGGYEVCEECSAASDVPATSAS